MSSDCLTSYCFCLTELEALKKDWMQEMKLQMAGNEEEMAEMAKSYEQKLKEAQEKAGMVKNMFLLIFEIQ